MVLALFRIRELAIARPELTKIFVGDAVPLDRRMSTCRTPAQYRASTRSATSGLARRAVTSAGQLVAEKTIENGSGVHLPVRRHLEPNEISSRGSRRRFDPGLGFYDEPRIRRGPSYASCASSSRSGQAPAAGSRARPSAAQGHAGEAGAAKKPRRKPNAKAKPKAKRP